MDVNRNSYNKIADQWGEDRSKYSFVTKVVIDFSKRVIPKGSILDIGCGTGFPNAKYLSEEGFSVTGIDFTETLLEKAKALNLPNANFILSDFFDYKPDTLFDGIIAFDSFFHFPREKQPLIYERVSAWMKTDSILLFTHGTVDGEITGEMFGEEFYYSSLSLNDVHNLLDKAGFEVLQTIENYRERDSDIPLVIMAKRK